MEDAIDGVAFALPWRHNRALNWSNYEMSFFAGFNQVTSPAFGNNNQAAEVLERRGLSKLMMATSKPTMPMSTTKIFWDARITTPALAYTRRYWQKISNSIRVIGNLGQEGPRVTRTADGVLLLLENSWVTRAPSTVGTLLEWLPGYGRPQSVARAAGSGGILRNTGINFESDNLTGYPTLDRLQDRMLMEARSV